jgi:hypothetical protein
MDKAIRNLEGFKIVCSNPLFISYGMDILNNEIFPVLYSRYFDNGYAHILNQYCISMNSITSIKNSSDINNIVDAVLKLKDVLLSPDVLCSGYYLKFVRNPPVGVNKISLCYGVRPTV